MKPKNIEVIWEDPTQDIRCYEFGRGPKPDVWTTRGYYAGETDELLYVASDFCADDNNFRGVACIHKSLIRKRRFIA